MAFCQPCMAFCQLFVRQYASFLYGNMPAKCEAFWQDTHFVLQNVILLGDNSPNTPFD